MRYENPLINKPSTPLAKPVAIVAVPAVPCLVNHPISGFPATSAALNALGSKLQIMISSLRIQSLTDVILGDRLKKCLDALGVTYAWNATEPALRLKLRTAIGLVASMVELDA